VSAVLDEVAPFHREVSPPLTGKRPAALPAFGARDAELIKTALAGRRGLFAVTLPALPYPVWLRAGTADADVCRAAFETGETTLPIPYRPRRILEIGAGAGYRSVALARRFPDAQILAIEADPAFARVHRLNSLPYHNITFIAAAVSDHAGHFGFTGRVMPSGAPSLAAQAAGPIKSVPLATLLEQHGWDTYDTVVMTPDPASIRLLSKGWPASVRMVAVRTAAHRVGPVIRGSFDESLYEIRAEGEDVTLFRREPGGNLAPPWPLPIFDPTGLPGGLVALHIAELPARFFPIFPYGVRLHPNGPRQPAPQLIIAHQCIGYREIRAKLRVGNQESLPVMFSIAVLMQPGGAALARLETVVAGGAVKDVALELPPYFGPCDVVLSTAMAELGSNNFAWAEFLDLAFH
jgi:FkbM family methyltransferase